MTKKELGSWRTIVQVLDSYGLYDLYKEEIHIVAEYIRKHKEKEDDRDRESKK